MDFAAILFVVPFLFFAPPKPDVPSLLKDYVQQDPGDSAITLLRLLSTISGVERDTVELLLGEDLAELGLHDPALSFYSSLARSPGAFAPAAFVGLARLRSAAGEDEALFHEAKLAPWSRMKGEDFAESLYRVGRACLRTNRFPEAREWLAQVPGDSSFYPFARYLLAQSEYALGRYARAVEAAEPIFSSRLPASSIAALRERATVLLGEMFIEIGLYDYAAQVLTGPVADGPFRRRATHDLLLARGLAGLEAAREGAAIDRAREVVSRANDSLAVTEQAIEDAAGSPEALSARAEELKRAWRPRGAPASRRIWTARRAIDALEESRGWGIRRFLDLAWRSFPPAILYRLALWTAEPETSAAPAPSAETRFFFAPSPEVSAALAANALLAERDGDTKCAARAAGALRSRAAAGLLGRLAPPTMAELSMVSLGCGEGGVEGLESAAEEDLRSAISTDALRRRREIRTRRFAIDEALAQASLDHTRAIQAARIGQ